LHQTLQQLKKDSLVKKNGSDVLAILNQIVHASVTDVTKILQLMGTVIVTVINLRRSIKYA
jgi:hypothetical protein